MEDQTKQRELEGRLLLSAAMVALAAMGGEIPIKYHGGVRPYENKPNPYARGGWHPKKARNQKGRR